VRDYLIKPFNEEANIERVRRVVPLDLKSAASPNRNALMTPSHSHRGRQARHRGPDSRRAGGHALEIAGAGQTDQALDIARNRDGPRVDQPVPSQNGCTLLFQNCVGTPDLKSLPVFALSVRPPPRTGPRPESGFHWHRTKPVDLEE